MDLSANLLAGLLALGWWLSQHPGLVLLATAAMWLAMALLAADRRRPRQGGGEAITRRLSTAKESAMKSYRKIAIIGSTLVLAGGASLLAVAHVISAKQHVIVTALTRSGEAAPVQTAYLTAQDETDHQLLVSFNDTPLKIYALQVRQYQTAAEADKSDPVVRPVVVSTSPGCLYAGRHYDIGEVYNGRVCFQSSAEWVLPETIPPSVESP